MANYTFPLNAQGWDDAGMPWDVANGSPLSGCLHGVGSNSHGAGIDGLSIAVVEDDPVSFRARIVAEEGDLGNVTVKLEAFDTGLDLADLSAVRSITEFPYDSGWFIVSGTLGGSGTVDTLQFTATSTSDGMNYDCYLDTVFVAESEGIDYALTRSAGGMPGAVAI